ncbi:hypothetical protein AYI68_g8102 [Smittium mucronatum]|uniref:Uncharacterized protein n=1 Tax=Smittium mucronatum TaxID=133383 RepID=A0A1R0GLW0_9FUNG|nr:hypothetical protein AYI68_g8102 [Smittium mucronatum]
MEDGADHTAIKISSENKKHVSDEFPKNKKESKNEGKRLSLNVDPALNRYSLENVDDDDEVLLDRKFSLSKKRNSDFFNKNKSIFSESGVGYFNREEYNYDHKLDQIKKTLSSQGIDEYVFGFRQNRNNSTRNNSINDGQRVMDRFRIHSRKKSRKFYKINKLALSKSNKKSLSSRVVTGDYGRRRKSSRISRLRYSSLDNGRISTRFSLDNFEINMFEKHSSEAFPGNGSSKTLESKKQESSRKISNSSGDSYENDLKFGMESGTKYEFGFPSEEKSSLGIRRGSLKKENTRSFLFDVKGYQDNDREEIFTDIIKGKNFHKETLFTRDSVHEKGVDYNYIELRNSRLNSVRDRLELYNNEKDPNFSNEKIKDTNVLWEKHINLLNDVFQFFSTALRSFNSHWGEEIIEVVDLWLQLYGQVILRQLRADYGELDCVGVEKIKMSTFARARMRVTSALSKLMCTEEMSENYNDPINYSLILALEQGFGGDSEVQAILHEAPALIGLNPNTRAYFGHLFRSMQLVIPEDYSHQRFFVSAKCLFGWISLPTNNRNIDLENLRVGLAILKRLLDFTRRTVPDEKSPNSGNIGSYSNGDTVVSNDSTELLTDMDENSFFKKYMEEKVVDHVEPIKNSPRFGKSNTGKNVSVQSKDSKIKSANSDKQNVSATRDSHELGDIDHRIYKKITLEEGLKESLNSVILSLNASLFIITEARDMICKNYLQKSLQKFGSPFGTLQPEFEIGLDLLIAKRELIKQSEGENCIQNVSYMYITNDSLISYTKLIPKNCNSQNVPTLITSRNINGKYSSVVSRVDYDIGRKSSLEDRDNEKNLNKNRKSSMMIELKKNLISTNDEMVDTINDPLGIDLSSKEFMDMKKSKSGVNLFSGSLGLERKSEEKISRHKSYDFFCSMDNDRRVSYKDRPFLNSIIGIDKRTVRSAKLAIPLMTLTETKINNSKSTHEDSETEIDDEGSDDDIKKLSEYDLKKNEESSSNIPEPEPRFSGIDFVSLLSRPSVEEKAIKEARRKSTLDRLDGKLQVTAPWVRSIKAERIAMSQSLARDARGLSTLRVDQLPNIKDINNTTMMSDIIRKDTERRTKNISESMANKHFKPIKPIKNQPRTNPPKYLGASSIFKGNFNKEKHIPIDISDELIRMVTLLDCLDSSFMMRLNVVCFESPLNAISKNLDCFRIKSKMPSDLVDILKSLGKITRNTDTNLNFGLSSHLGFRNSDNKNNVLFQVSPNLLIPEEKEKRTSIVTNESVGYIDSSFEKRLSIDKQVFLDNITGKKGIQTNSRQSFYNKLISMGGVGQVEKDAQVYPCCLKRFFRCVLQDSIVLVYVSSGIEDINMQYFWEKISLNYSKLKDPFDFDSRSMDSKASTLNSPTNSSFSCTTNDSLNTSISSNEGLGNSSSVYNGLEKTESKDNKKDKHFSTKSESKAYIKAPSRTPKNLSLDIERLKSNMNISGGRSCPFSEKNASNRENEYFQDDTKKCTECLDSNFDLFDIIEPVPESKLKTKPKFAILVCPVRATKGQVFRVRLVATSRDSDVRDSLLSNTGPLISGMSIHRTQLPLLLLSTMIEAKKNLFSLEHGSFSTLLKRKKMIEFIKNDFLKYGIDDKNSSITHYIKYFSN